MDDFLSILVFWIKQRELRRKIIDQAQVSKNSPLWRTVSLRERVWADVLKARVATIGPEEHTIIAESGSQKAKQWTLYDVGGSRGQRGAYRYEIGALLKPLIVKIA